MGSVRWGGMSTLGAMFVLVGVLAGCPGDPAPAETAVGVADDAPVLGIDLPGDGGSPGWEIAFAAHPGGAAEALVPDLAGLLAAARPACPLPADATATLELRLTAGRIARAVAASDPAGCLARRLDGSPLPAAPDGGTVTVQVRQRR